MTSTLGSADNHYGEQISIPGEFLNLFIRVFWLNGVLGFPL